MDAPSALEGGAQRRVVDQGAVGDRLVDTHQVLVEPPARADRQVADLGVPHLPGREPGGLARRLDRRVRVLGPETVEHGRLRQVDGISWTGGRAAPSVQDDERYERTSTDARQIAANDSTSSDAPPTSAPSTEGCPSRSAAFSGLTEPP